MPEEPPVALLGDLASVALGHLGRLDIEQALARSRDESAQVHDRRQTLLGPLGQGPARIPA